MNSSLPENFFFTLILFFSRSSRTRKRQRIDHENEYLYAVMKYNPNALSNAGMTQGAIRKRVQGISIGTRSIRGRPFCTHESITVHFVQNNGLLQHTKNENRLEATTDSTGEASERNPERSSFSAGCTIGLVMCPS